MLNQCQNHRCICRRHHGLPAQHAAHAEQLVTLGQANTHAVSICRHNLEAQILDPRRKVIGKRLLKCLNGDAHGCSSAVNPAVLRDSSTCATWG